jgi:uncharacterized membrane protein YjgN (DUF898 family)
MPRRSLAFTGSAEELRRSLRRDVLINLVLGGLYTSVVRRHTARYLEERTTLDGTRLAHVPVHKSPWPAILLVVLFVAARLASEAGHGPPLPVLVVCGVLLIPWLWGTVIARTIGAVRWRDLPLAFTARWSEVYAASWPLFVLGVAWAVCEPTVLALVEAGTADVRVAAGAVVSAVVAFPLLAAQAFNFRRLRFTRTRVGDLDVAWAARFPAYLRLWTLTALAILATAIAPVLALRHAVLGAVSWQGLHGGMALAAYAVGYVLLVLLSTPARAWYEARMFVLTWDGVRVGDRFLVRCALDTRAFVRMRTVGTRRTLCTLGVHHARAVVQAYEAKLAALTVHPLGPGDPMPQQPVSPSGLPPRRPRAT